MKFRYRENYLIRAFAPWLRADPRTEKEKAIHVN